MITIQDIVEKAYIYIPLNCEAMVIMATIRDEGHFLGEGEETGESYQVYFSEVNLEEDLFYNLSLMDTRS